MPHHKQSHQWFSHCLFVPYVFVRGGFGIWQLSVLFTSVLHALRNSAFYCISGLPAFRQSLITDLLILSTLLMHNTLLRNRIRIGLHKQAIFLCRHADFTAKQEKWYCQRQVELHLRLAPLC